MECVDGMSHFLLSSFLGWGGLENSSDLNWLSLGRNFTRDCVFQKWTTTRKSFQEFQAVVQNTVTNSRLLCKWIEEIFLRLLRKVSWHHWFVTVQTFKTRKHIFLFKLFYSKIPNVHFSLWRWKISVSFRKQIRILVENLFKKKFKNFNIFWSANHRLNINLWAIRWKAYLRVCFLFICSFTVKSFTI